MQNNLSEQIRDCYRHAQDCARKAAEQTDPNLKQDFLVIERRWRSLAGGYENRSTLDPLFRREKTGLSQVKTAAEYRTMAQECFKWAREAKANEVRVSLLQLAQVWLDAAAKLDGLPTTARSAD